MKDSKIFFCVYEKKGGRNPEEMNEEQLQILGRSLARIHNVGATKNSKHRIKLTPESYGDANLDFLKNSNLLVPEISESYTSPRR